MHYRSFLCLLAAILISGCQYLPWGKDDAKPIFVDEPETIIVQPPEDAFDVTYRWSIIDLPDESLLVPDFSSSSNVFTFSPDVEGDYAFAVVVESYGEDLAEHIMRFAATEDTSVVPRQAVDDMATAPATDTAPPPVYTPATPQPVALAPVVAAKKPAAKAPAKKSPTRKTTRPRATKKKIAKDVVRGHYTIQVSSWKTAKQAHTVRQQLVDMGYDAYIQRIWLEDRQEVWWRVRLGDYESIQEAKKLRKEIAKTFSTAWVDNVRKEMIEEGK
ncbi:MAG: SPOR domain-containing protein [Candidatus Marinimicrobia bacterium]|nr:SPOR domain-containing protein [Candidatus Neomarinimicrobiota bacterium]